MITCGIDIGKGKHAVAIIDELGRQLVRTRFYDNTRAGAEKLMEELARHAEPAQVHVGMESTGNYWRAYYDFLSKKGCVVDVINPIVTSASSAGDIRGRKTDKRDAEAIAEVVMRGKWYTLSRAFVGKSGGGPSRPHKPDLSTTNGKDEEEQELPQIPFATFPCPAHVRA